MEKNKQDSKEQVVISKEDFKKMQEDINLLKGTVSRYKLEEQEALLKGKKKKLPRGHLKKVNGKLILSWLGLNVAGSKAEQKILYQGTTPVGEVMIGHYKVLDDEDLVCEASKFYKSTDLEKFTKIGQEGDNWIIKFDDPELPQKMSINIKFINP